MYGALRKRLFAILEKGSREDRESRQFDLFIITLIVLNVIAIILESFQELEQSYRQIFHDFELVSVIVFTAEYLLRIWTADLKYPNSGPVGSRIRYFFSFEALIDLLAILPFYLPFFVSLDLRFIRILRLTRLFRILKLNRYSESLLVIGRVLKKESEILLSTVFVTFILLLIASSLMYTIENEAQPDNFPNILASFWWAVATLTTVGYGDVYPVTAAGKILSGIIALLGIGLVALPTGIISSGFIEEISKRKENRTNTSLDEKPHLCPHCGKPIDPP